VFFFSLGGGGGGGVGGGGAGGGGGVGGGGGFFYFFWGGLFFFFFGGGGGGGGPTRGGRDRLKVAMSKRVAPRGRKTGPRGSLGPRMRCACTGVPIRSEHKPLDSDSARNPYPRRLPFQNRKASVPGEPEIFFDSSVRVVVHAETASPAPSNPIGEKPGRLVFRASGPGG